MGHNVLCYREMFLHITVYCARAVDISEQGKEYGKMPAHGGRMENMEKI